MTLDPQRKSGEIVSFRQLVRPQRVKSAAFRLFPRFLPKTQAETLPHRMQKQLVWDWLTQHKAEKKPRLIEIRPKLDLSTEYTTGHI